MASLEFLAAGVQDATEPIRRDVTRSRKPNPFESHVQASWDARQWDEDKEMEVGATKQVDTSSDEQTADVVRAIRLAGKNLRLGVRISAPHDKYVEDDKTKIEYRAGVVKFSTKELTVRSENGDATAAQSEEGSEDA